MVSSFCLHFTEVVLICKIKVSKYPKYKSDKKNKIRARTNPKTVEKKSINF